MQISVTSFLECVGSHGFNCTSPCPPSWYGALCRFRCSCPDDECDLVNGCNKGPGYFICCYFWNLGVFLYMSVHWIKMHFLFLPLYRKIECSVSASWLQNKSKSICVKSGWYLFSTGNNACGYKIRKYKFSAWHEIRQYKFSTQNSTKVVIAR